MKGLHIQDVDTDKYLENYFNRNDETSCEIDLKRERERHLNRIKEIKGDARLPDNEKQSCLEYEEKHHRGMIDCINITTYWRSPTEREKELMQYDIEAEIEWRTRHYENQLEQLPLPKGKIMTDYLERTLNEIPPHFKEIQRKVLEGRLVQDFFTVARYIGFIKFAQKLDNDCSAENNHENNNHPPIKWIGKTAHLGYYMTLFAESGYIDAPVKKDGEINYNEFARQLAKTFDFDGNNIGTLAKALSPESNNMNIDNKDKIKIPHLKDLV